jgi:hypothetical protein
MPNQPAIDAATPAPPAERASDAASAIAQTFRAFDAGLSADDVAQIARRIDANRAAGATLNPPAHPLRNADEMVARFAVDVSH